MKNSLIISFIILVNIIVLGCNQKISYSLSKHDYFSPIFLQINENSSFIYVVPSSIIFGNIGTWEKIGSDTIVLKNLKPCNIYHNDTAMKTLVFSYEDTIQSINLKNIRDFEAIKNYVINGEDTLKFFLNADSSIFYTKKIHLLQPNDVEEPDGYTFDTTKTFRIEISQIKTKRYVYRFDMSDKISKTFIITKKGLKTTKENHEIILKRISNKKFKKEVFRDYIIIEK